MCPKIPEERSAEDYLGQVRKLRASGDLQAALALAEEASDNHIDDHRLLLERARIYRALGNYQKAHETECDAMDVMYITKSKVTDSQRGPPKKNDDYEQSDRDKRPRTRRVSSASSFP
jgi:tetratricopeptide (TPR) repeat protein